MRIALLSDRFPPEAGGVAIAAARLARGLAEAGDEVEVLALSAEGLPGSVAVQVELAGLTVLRVGASRRPM